MTEEEKDPAVQKRNCQCKILTDLPKLTVKYLIHLLTPFMSLGASSIKCGLAISTERRTQWNVKWLYTYL